MASCLRPVKVYNKYLGKTIWTSCRKCSHCLENNRQQWKFRLLCEQLTSSLSVHLTLQYSDDYISTNVLDVRDLQKFFKRLRAAGFLFSYYAIGEYGTRDKRKHFHVAFFLKSQQRFDELKDEIIKQWYYGYIYFTRLTVARMGYVLHYHVRPKIVDGKPTIAVQSKGLGADWFAKPDIQRFILCSNSIQVQGSDGMFYTFPRYYRRKFGLEISYDVGLPSAIRTLQKIHKCKLSELSPQDVMSYYITLMQKDDVKLQKYNHKSE